MLNTSDYLWGVSYYDSKHGAIQNFTSNHRGGADQTTFVVDFAGKVLLTKTTKREPQNLTLKFTAGLTMIMPGG